MRIEVTYDPNISSGIELSVHFIQVLVDDPQASILGGGTTRKHTRLQSGWSSPGDSESTSRHNGAIGQHRGPSTIMDGRVRHRNRNGYSLVL
ncbi:hypothetical protein TIFTF001_031100 [Ficus carica]|uniref:Uncharacterized protein n=1 Tax=Ficus carica TaxID=3494 RepID=A0AA88DUS2_FICCA|nr:hypothetical protein TIFTF001_031100 [Ficus carica]